VLKPKTYLLVEENGNLFKEENGNLFIDVSYNEATDVLTFSPNGDLCTEGGTPMRAKSLLIGTVFALCGTAADAQWVVTDPGNLAQSIINMSDNIAHTSKTAVNTAESFAETVKIYEQAKRYYDQLKAVNNLIQDARKVRDIILMVGDVSDIYVTNFGKMMNDGNFSPRELDAIAFGYARLLEESNGVLQDRDVVRHVDDALGKVAGVGHHPLRVRSGTAQGEHGPYQVFARSGKARVLKPKTYLLVEENGNLFINTGYRIAPPGPRAAKLVTVGTVLRAALQYQGGHAYQAHRQFHKGSVSHNRSCLKVDVCLCSSRLFSAIRLTAASRSPPDSSANRCTSSFSDSSVENVKYSSSLTSVAYTAEWVPPSPIHTSR